MKILGIESSCDETAAAVVEDGTKILSNVISSQVDLHAHFGGVVPELACRRHIDLLIPVIRKALEQAECSLNDIDLIAVTRGPGLIGALLIGLNGAKALAFGANKPIIGVNHIEAHLYASLMGPEEKPPFPYLGVVVSGGHSSLVIMHSIGRYQQIGTTIDDAVGEAFDKVARLLDLPYPGGPEVEKLARSGDASKFSLRPGKVKNSPYSFSFSGLKTAALYAAKGKGANKHSPLLLDEEGKAHLAAAFQEAALGDIREKAYAAAKAYGCHAIVFGGGVSNNRRLRALMDESEDSLPVFWPPAGLSLDNAAMIAGLAYHQYKKHGADQIHEINAQTRIPFAVDPIIS
ncbi:MAG: tRNA (adenosine(37)-N6)-threonylcarbamoyltransferase complex transferase subunit TsaD [Waddliaceae bacterium]|nr:tRNA (adenosine(37)-N6)-threonylcarbamoyltransferase complex transferase subunit TsaD [Waddliaceae bacterium]